MSSPDISIHGSLALECVRALAAGLSAEARVELLRGLLTGEERAAAWKELMREHGALPSDHAATLTPWTPAGLQIVANRENCPYLKGPLCGPLR